MLSSAWSRLTGSKHGREEKQSNGDEKLQDLVAQTESLPPSLPQSAAAAPAADAARKRSSGRQRSKQPRLDSAIAASSLQHPMQPQQPGPPLSASPPPLYALHAAADPASAGLPAVAPPSYADSLAVSAQYPVASPASHPQPHPGLYTAYPVEAAERKESEEEKKVMQAAPVPALPPAAQGGMQVAVPLMVDPAPRMSQRLLDQASAAWLRLQAHPQFQAGQAKAVQLVNRHVPPELQAFMAAPSLGKLLLHPQWLLLLYRLYASVRAPFVGLFKGILMNAAKRALWQSEQEKARGAALAGGLNDHINAALKDAIGRDFQVQLSPEVCQRIVANIGVEDLTKIFSWFTSTQVKEKAAGAPAL